jgi:hypothetical protein
MTDLGEISTMHVEFLIEEPSVEAALGNLVPSLLPQGTTFAFRVFNGKPDLLKNLECRLRGYRRWIGRDDRIVVLVDEDRQDCRKLKTQMERIASDCGFSTKTRTNDVGEFQVLTRIAIEELEAWFFGDPEALIAVFPRLSARVFGKAKYRDPDAMGGGTAETLESLLKRAGYYTNGMPKIEVATRISAMMDPLRNRSRSFQVFRDGLRALR